MIYEKYKDERPDVTVQNIKEIFKNTLGLEMELRVSERIEGIYSATLTDKKAFWNTSGKGTTEAFCAASAYGESIEHLCNYFAYDIDNLSKEAVSSYRFEKYPDETIKDLCEIEKEIPDMLLDIEAAYSMNGKEETSNEEMIKLWKKFLGRDKVPFVPYYSVKEGQYKKIPEDLVFYLCGSNGGGAGNTAEEAIGHACDEILERYVKYTIYMNGLTPPEIPREYIVNKCPELVNTINKLEEIEGYKVLVKDASLGKNFSVLSVALIDKRRSKYLVNFGAHPKFEIALERCLTEILQAFTPGGSNLRKHMEKWSLESQNRATIPQNWVNILKDDSGAVPNSYFGAQFSWEFIPWPQYNDYTNKLGMKIQINTLLSIAPNVYIHDVSYLGFPVFRVYVPTISTSHVPFDNFQLRCYEIMRNFIMKAQSFRLSINEIEEIENTLFNENTFVNGLVFRSIGESNFHLLHAAACYDLSKYEEAKKFLRLSCSDYGECLIRKIELLQMDYNFCEIDNLLSVFYYDNYVEMTRKWEKGKAFSSMLYYLSEQGITISQKMVLENDIINERNVLHIKLKEAMAKIKKDEKLTALFAGDQL